MTAVLSNPANVDARAARLADRLARQQYIAEQRAAEAAAAAEQAPADDWDAPVPFVPTAAAESALSAPSADEPADDWRAILAPAPVATITPAALHALAAAVKGVADEDVPVLAYAHVTLAADSVSILSTDRYRVHSLTLPAEGPLQPVDAYVNVKELGAVARALAPAAARRGAYGTLPSIRVTVDAEHGDVTWEAPDARHVTTWDTSMSYPPAERFLAPEDERVMVPEWCVNPRYMGAALTAAAAIAERNTPARVTADAAAAADVPHPMIRVHAGDPESPTGVFEACIMSVRW